MSILSGRTVSILGDSYSTFKGFIPDGYSCYYPNPNNVTDVLCVEDTWWQKLIIDKGMRLLVNNSYSGATVCTHVRDTQPVSASFAERVMCSFRDVDDSDPDYIIVFGCTNDSWIDREIGELQYGNWSENDLRRVLPAYCYVLNVLLEKYPKSKIVSVINTKLNPGIADGMLEAGEHYDVTSVRLKDIDKQNGHPSALGMRQIADQICEALEG